MSAVHLQRLQYAVHGKDPLFMFTSMCGAIRFAGTEKPDSVTTDPRKVTCKRCLRARNADTYRNSEAQP